MVDFIAFLQAAQDGNGVLHGGLVDQDCLKAAFQGRVLFDVLSVFVQRRRADQMQLASREHRFQQIGGIHCPFGCSGSDDRVQFVDEEENLALRRLDLFQDGFEPFLKFTAKFGTGDKGTHIQGKKFFVFEAFGDIAFHDTNSQSFHDCSFSDSWFTDEHRIILRPA